MTRPADVVRWESTRDPSRCGIEIVNFALGLHRMESELDRRLRGSEVDRPAFIIASPVNARPGEIAVAISQAANFLSAARVCIAVDGKTLSDTDPKLLRNKRVGIVLDRVGAQTPLSALCSDLVEAVRFEESFIGAATQDARLGCVLDAMMKCAHDLGLATLAPVARSGPHIPQVLDFDYVRSPQPAS